MKIEVIYEQMDFALMGGMAMDERHVVQPDGEFIQWLNRTMGRTDLFIYHHQEHGTFVLAQWLNRDHRVCAELESWTAPPDWMQSQIPGEKYWKIRLVGADEGNARMKRQILNRHAEIKSAKADTQVQKASVSKYMRHHGMEDAAKLLDMGATPFVGSRESKLAKAEGLGVKV